MAQQPNDVYAHLAVPPSDAERASGRVWARRVLAETRAAEPEGLREELRRRFRSEAA